MLNGNLTYIRQPLLLGHYRALELTGTEDVIDRHLGGSMRAALRAGLYPEAAGSHQVFLNTGKASDNPWQLPQPQAAIVIGLGEEGSLKMAALEDSVALGCKAWSQRAAELTPGNSANIELAATLIGSGGMGSTPGSAARAIARGVRKANEALALTSWPMITRLTLVEWYLDRAGDAWRGLQVLADSVPGLYAITPTIATGTGPLRRQLDNGYRGTDHDLISVTTPAEGLLSFALDTRRARTEVSGQRTQPALLRKLVEQAARAGPNQAGLGRTLFQLLVPLELAPFLSGTDRVVMQVDAGSAPIPWEMLDNSGNTEGPEHVLPWAIRTQLLRSMRTSTFRQAPRDASLDAAVLVIGEPKVDNPDYPALPGARQEAEEVVEALSRSDAIARDKLFALTSDATFDTVIVALMARPYRIVHIAGHGEAIQRDKATGAVTSWGGVVLSKGCFLGPDEIAKLPVVPELVFVNCCHLGGKDAKEALRMPDPTGFAAGVADALINIGVRCVVAAGWAVDDTAAASFAQAFYKALLAGEAFIEAVSQARLAAWKAAPGSNTWAAYQCYGDPDWVLRNGSAAPARKEGRKAGSDDVIASAPGLALLLEDLSQRLRFRAFDTPAEREAARSALQERLRKLEAGYDAQWGGIGAVAEAFAVAWEATGDTDRTVAWYGRALLANDASASMKVLEQLCNLQVRAALAEAKTAQSASNTRGVNAARKTLLSALGKLKALADAQPTLERHALCGSAYKRLGQMEAAAGRAAPAAKAYALALDSYQKAEALALRDAPAQLFYPGQNRMALEWVLNVDKRDWPGFDALASAGVRTSLTDKHQVDPDFWSSAGLVEQDLLEALGAHQLTDRRVAITASFRELHRRVQTASCWRSVAEQARFVLGAYGPSATAAEQRAAADLLKLLDGYAA